MVEQTTLAVASSSVDVIAHKPAEGDYSFLQEGRSKLKKYCRDRALAKVRSMVQYPDAWDQYQRNLTVVTKMQEPQVVLIKNGRFPCVFFRNGVTGLCIN
jgi:endonuclease YncB( thermonuclease family)